MPDPSSSTKPQPTDEPVLERRSLSQQLAERLREMILDGDLAPGERLQEIELSARFGVSRTPLREAMKALSSEGLVTLTPNRGAAVSKLKPEEVAEIFPVMGALEALAGELACVHATDDEISELAHLHSELMVHYTARDQAAYYDTNQEVHNLILKAARNTTLAEQYNQLAGRVSRARFRGTMSDAEWAKSVAEHEALMAALTRRDGSRVARILKTHVDTKLETVRDRLA
jgi:DNA-binding GntR family transcriptional regulator